MFWDEMEWYKDDDEMRLCKDIKSGDFFFLLCKLWLCYCYVKFFIRGKLSTIILHAKQIWQK